MTGEEFLNHVKQLGKEAVSAEARYRAVFRSLTGTSPDYSKPFIDSSPTGDKYSAISIAGEQRDAAKRSYDDAAARLLELIEDFPTKEKESLTYRYINRLKPNKTARKMGISPEWERAIHLRAKAAFNEVWEKRGD